jgi:hypothetical protein
MAISDLLTSAMSAGGRCARYGDFVVVYLQSLSFATTAQDFQMVQRWARGRRSCGNVHRDRSSFVDHFEFVIARTGSGIASKGSKAVLQRIVNGMNQNGMQISEWQVPQSLFESVEIRRKAKPAETPA